MAAVPHHDEMPHDDESLSDSSEEETLEPQHEMLPPNLSRGIVANAIIEESLMDDGRQSRKKTASTVRSDKKSRRCMPQVKALAISAFLFALITVLQVGAAKIAHSQALLMDCISMAVDSFTYMGNIFVECKKRDGGQHAFSQLVIVSLSLSLLCYFTLTAMQDSWHTVLICQGDLPPDPADPDEVNRWITLGFGIGGLGFDIACLMEFYKSNKKTGTSRHVNMFSAFLHVSADFLRSTSTVVMSLLILLCKIDSVCLDAYCSVFIGVTIIMGAFVGFFKWIKLLISVCCKTEYVE